MQNRHSMSLGIHFHILHCSSLYSQPQPEQQRQPEKAAGWQKEPVPKPAPAPASSETFLLSGLGGHKFSRKRHHPAGAPQTHHSPALGGPGGSGTGGKGPAAPGPSPRSLPEPASPTTQPHRHWRSWCLARQGCPWGPCQRERRLSWQLPNPSPQLGR